MLSVQSATAGSLDNSGIRVQRVTRAAPASLECPGPASQQHHLDGEMLTTKEGSQSGYNQWLLFDEGA